MNRLRALLRHHDTGDRFPVPRPVASLHSFAVPTESKMDYREAYELELRVRMRYYATNDYVGVAKNNAVRLLIQHVYGDALETISKLRAAAYAEDTTEILRTLDKFEAELTE